MVPMAVEKESATRTRLLEESVVVFATQGYAKATIREICTRAHANVAAVNYYFGDKDQLYAAVLRHWAEEAVRAFPPDMGVGHDAGAEERLQGFIHGMLSRFLISKGPHSHYIKLLARELVDPTPALDAVVEEVIRPMAEQLHQIVRELMRKETEERVIRRYVLSIVGQCLLYKDESQIIDRLYGPQRFETEDIDALAKHIARFSLAALKSR